MKRLPEFLARVRVRIETALDHRLPPVNSEPRRLHAAMRYVTLGGGKRLRAELVLAPGGAPPAPARLNSPPPRPALTIDPAQRLAMLAQLAQAAGSAGMAGGQAIDPGAGGHPLTLPRGRDQPPRQTR